MNKQEIRSVGYVTAAMIFGLILISGCASIQVWQDDQRTAENKMFVIQEKIGEGLKTGALSLDQSQSFLMKLKAIRSEYAALKDKSVYREEWDNLITRIDGLGEEIDRAMAGRQELLNPALGTGLPHFKGELMMEAPASVCLLQRSGIFNSDWTPFGVTICG